MDLLDEWSNELSNNFSHTVLYEIYNAASQQLPGGPLLTANDIADYLSLSLRTVETLVAEGMLEPLYIRGSRRFTPEAVETFLTNCKNQREAGEDQE